MMTKYKKPIWNDNPFDQWTEEEVRCMEEEGTCYGKGGGGSQSAPPAPAVTTQVQQSEFPSELKPFIEDIFGKASALQKSKEEEGFQAFKGPLQAEFDPAQVQAFEQIEAIPGATQPLFDEATGLIQSAAGPLPTAEELQAASNPFVRNVIDIEKREAQRVADVQKQQQDFQAARAGAFGGSRAGILEAERLRNLNQQLGDIESKGQLAAFQDAQQRIAAQRGREAGGSAQLAALGSAIPAQQFKELGALSGVGAARQTQEQRGIDLARQEFEAEEAFPSQTLQEFQSVLRGFPLAPTRSTSTKEFSAAQPLSTQLLGVGTQALGALGASGALKGAFGQAGGMVQDLPRKSALQSLVQNVEGYNTQPVLGMSTGGGFGRKILEQTLSRGLLGTDKIRGALFKTLNKHPIIEKLIGGAAFPKLLGMMPEKTPAPTPAAPTLPAPTPKEIDERINLALRQRAAQGQQTGSRGTGPGQIGSQVKQAFKGGGGLRQMVQLPLPTNRVQFGKTAYQDGSYVGEVLEEKIVEPVTEFFTQPFDILNARDRAKFMRKEAEIDKARYGGAFDIPGEAFGLTTGEILESIGISEGTFNPQRYTDLFSPGEASIYLKARDKRKKEFEKSLDKEKKSKDQKDENKAAKKDTAKTKTPQKKKRGDELYLTPEEAGFRALMDYEGFEDKTPMVNKPMDAMSVLARNMKAGTGAVTEYMKAKEAQALLRDAAAKKQAASIAAAKTARLKNQLTMSEIKRNLDANDSAALNALTKLLESPAVLDNTEAQLDIQNKIKFYINKAQNNALTDLTQRGTQQYGGSPSAMNQIALERKRAEQLAAEQKAKES